MGIIETKSDLVRLYLSKYPTRSKRAIAGIVYSKHYDLFTDKEAVRSLIRYVTGASGDKLRKVIKNVVNHPGPASIEDIPQGLTEVDDFSPHEQGGSLSLILCDIHVPFQNSEALKIALQDGKDRGCDSVVINGDMVNFSDLSRWVRDPRFRFANSEVTQTRQILEIIRNTLPNAYITFKVANHEERLITYMIKKAPELLDYEVMTYEDLFQLDKLDIALIEEKRNIKVGDYNVIHGHEKSVSTGVSPSRGLFMKFNAPMVCGHYHAPSEYLKINPITKERIKCYSVGCLCDLAPQYAPYNEWGLGYMIMEHGGENYNIEL